MPYLLFDRHNQWTTLQEPPVSTSTIKQGEHSKGEEKSVLFQKAGPGSSQGVRSYDAFERFGVGRTKLGTKKDVSAGGETIAMHKVRLFTNIQVVV